MNLATFFLVCFVVGLVFCFLSLLGGAGKFHFGAHIHWHVPHPGGAHVPFFNAFSLMAFLAWFGGTGYLLSEYSHLWFLFALLVATAVGLVGAGIVFWYVAKVLIAQSSYLNPEDFEMVGVLGRITSGIRQGGTGEIVYSMAGTRRVSGARSEDGLAIARGTEVMVTRYERGLAYVRPWEDVSK